MLNLVLKTRKMPEAMKYYNHSPGADENVKNGQKL